VNGTCREFRHLVHALVDGEIRGPRAVALQFHAAACAPCGARLESARELAAALHRLGRHPAQPPDDFVPRLMQRLAACRPLRIRRAGWMAGAAALTVAGLGLAARLLISGTGGASEPLLPGVRAGLEIVGMWLARFAALVEGLGGLPALPPGPPELSAGSSFLAGLILIASGLLGAAAALTLSARQALAATRQRPA
jgi:hypothetical protein